MNLTGWDRLYVHSSFAYEDPKQVYAAGFVEGNYAILLAYFIYLFFACVLIFKCRCDDCASNQRVLQSNSIHVPIWLTSRRIIPSTFYIGFWGGLKDWSDDSCRSLWRKLLLFATRKRSGFALKLRTIDMTVIGDRHVPSCHNGFNCLLLTISTMCRSAMS